MKNIDIRLKVIVFAIYMYIVYQSLFYVPYILFVSFVFLWPFYIVSYLFGRANYKYKILHFLPLLVFAFYLVLGFIVVGNGDLSGYFHILITPIKRF